MIDGFSRKQHWQPHKKQHVLLKQNMTNVSRQFEPRKEYTEEPSKTRSSKKLKPLKRWKVYISKSARHLHHYAKQVLMWAIYLNGFYSIAQFCLFVGLTPPYHNIKYAILLLEEFNIMCKILTIMEKIFTD